MLSFSAFTLLITIGFANAQDCGPDMHARLDRCNTVFGFNQVDPNSSSRQDAIDVPKLLQYCRNPRQSLELCVEAAYGGCDRGWTEEERPFFEKAIRFASQSLDYLCSMTSTIDANKDCLEGASRGITRCMLSAKRKFFRDERVLNEPTKEAVPLSRMLEPWERMARRQETCIHNLLKVSCNIEIANVFGNFFYGFATHVFDDAN